MKIVIDVDEYEQLKLAASKLAESEKIIKEHLKIKPERHCRVKIWTILNYTLSLKCGLECAQ